MKELEDAYEEKRRRELQLKYEREKAKQKIIVKTVFDLTEKYEDYDIQVDGFRKIAKLRKAMEVKYLPRFRYDCEILGLTCEIEAR